jgi:hypothetical protein
MAKVRGPRSESSVTTTTTTAPGLVGLTSRLFSELAAGRKGARASASWGGVGINGRSRR